MIWKNIGYISKRFMLMQIAGQKYINLPSYL